jgi:hypothetical protein
VQRVSTEYVYLIGSEASTLVKIGRSTDVPRRLADIQRMSPAKLAVLWQTEGGAGLETSLHRHFRAQRSHGEWFDFPAHDAAEQVVHAIAEIAVKAKRLADMLTSPPVMSESRKQAMGALDRELACEIAEIREIPDLTDRAAAVLRAQERHRQDISKLAVMRRGIIRDLLDMGFSQAELAEHLNITHARMSQLTAEVVAMT